MKKDTKVRTVYVCQSCGYRTSGWLGRCPDCREWQSLEEESSPETPGRHVGRSVSGAGRVRPLTETAVNAEARLITGIAELDRVLGGGVVPGGVVLLGGEPGIGKSTLILQMLRNLAMHERGVLYVSGEESAGQISLRAGRIKAFHPRLLLATESCVETITGLAEEYRPALLAVDSIQTLYTGQSSSAPGSITQVRESAARLISLAKSGGIPIFLVGHVTKEGAIAGPRVLEHMVDCVLYFESDGGHAFRILRTVKNRYGSTNEIGVFEMKESGLAGVDNPSAVFLAERSKDVPGSVVLPSMEGSRPILVEVQALVSPTSFGTPRRTAIGIDQQRLALLTAVLEKKAQMLLYQHDIFVNIAGGIRIEEPALDLGVVSAVASSLLDKPLSAACAVCGEVGLAGEVRAVGQMEQRIREAERLGFERLILPGSNLEKLPAGRRKGPLEIVGVTDINGLLGVLFEGQ